MLRQIKPKNARSKRALDKRAPQVTENTKTALFLRYTTCSEVTKLCMKDFQSLKAPLVQVFDKKNNIHPFQDPASLEFFSEKNDVSLMVFGSTNKKRPHCLTLVRMFSHKVLDMIELMIVPETMRTLKQIKSSKPGVGLKPLISFSGTPFESPTANKYTLARSILLDLFRGENTNSIDAAGLQYMIHFSAGEEVSGEPEPQIHMRCYMIKSKKSGQKLPRVEIEEMGPRVDFRVGRIRAADADMLKEAMRKPRGIEVCCTFSTSVSKQVLTIMSCRQRRRRTSRPTSSETRSVAYTLASRISAACNRAR